jgi:hypothetical protein
MSNNERPAYRDDDFGNCPECGRTNGDLSVGDDDWYYCREHKTKWRYDSFDLGELFKGEYARNRAILSECREVEPVFPHREDPWEALDHIKNGLTGENCPWRKKYGVLEALELAIAAFAVEEPTRELCGVASFLDALLGQLSAVLGQLSARQRPPITPPKTEDEVELDLDTEIPF